MVTMSKRDQGWSRIVESNRVQEWLEDESSKVTQLTRSDFYAVGQKPVSMIPTYEVGGLPKALTERGIELLRNQPGGCLLIKTKLQGIRTLYPKLNAPDEKYEGPSFHTIPKLTVLTSAGRKLVNEETGIHLAWSMGVIQSFLMDRYSPFEAFSLGGRLKTRVHGEFEILGLSHPVDALVEADGYFESDSHIIVLEAKRTSARRPQLDFSIHQILLPVLLVRSQSEKQVSSLLLIWSIDWHVGQTTLDFKLYHFEIPGLHTQLNPFDYSLGGSKEYLITI